jgi:septal ring factor EnvC (AmiA/AmiB activator)
MRSLGSAVFLLLILVFGMALAEVSDSQDATVKDRHKSVIREIEKKKQRHGDLRKKEKSLLDQLDQLARTQARKKKDLRSLQKDRSKIEKAISSHEGEMRQLRNQMDITQKQIQARIAALYKISKVGPWVFLLSGETYGDLLRMFAFLNSMIDYDVRLFNRFESQLDREKALQQKLSADKNRLEEKQREARLRKREIEELKRKQKGALKKVRAEKDSFARVIRDLGKQAERLESLVKTLSKKKKASPQGSGFAELRGRLPVPVAGKIDQKPHGRLRGINLKAPLGATVRSVYKGRVVYADWFKGYGNLLIIDHGDKFHTVIGHVSEMLKERNDWVETGEPVARVGDTGSFGGPLVYFEIRRGGIPVDPLDWFSREDRLALR